MMTRPRPCSLPFTVYAARILRLRSAPARPHDDVGTFLNLFIDVHRSSVLYVFVLMSVYNDDHRKLACAQHITPYRDCVGRL
jgi:hypothetical protein